MPPAVIPAGSVERAWEFFRKIGSPKFHVAPMVDQVKGSGPTREFPSAHRGSRSPASICLSLRLLWHHMLDLPKNIIPMLLEHAVY